jgi:hypothetical protein
MTVSAGTRLGTYEVVSVLGAGGPTFAHRTSYGGSTEAMERT